VSGGSPAGDAAADPPVKVQRSPVRSSAELARARVARRVVAIVLVAMAGVACVLAALGVTRGWPGSVRLVVTPTFLLLGPGWAVAGFLRRAPAAHVWLLCVGVGVATTLLVGQVMVMTGAWAPVGALYLTAAVSVPFLLRHAVVAQ
jgi:hypothetical protein